MMMELAEEYRQVCPEVTILAGGPEVSFHSEELLRQHPALDGIFYGEGEVPFWEYLQYQNGERPLPQVHSLVWRDGEQIVCNPTAGPLPMEQLPFAYSDLEQLQNRILYFESIRGCPFRCSYCLSSVAGRVRYLPLELASACSGFWTPGCRRSNLSTAPSTAPRSTRWPSGATLPRTTTA